MSKTIEFEGYQLPSINSGLYRVEQKLEITIPGQESYTSEQYFYVASERYFIPPAQVFAVYPPDKGIGDYAKVLPHLELNRSSLPWERNGRLQADTNSLHTPWLALILLDEIELSNPLLVKQETLTWKDYQKVCSLATEPGEDSAAAQAQQLPILWLEPGFLKKINPSAQDAASLCHVRKVLENNELQQERAIILANRLPAPGHQTRAFLVSLEGRFELDDSVSKNARPSDGFIPLLCLYSWSFEAIIEDYSGNLSSILKALKLQDFSIPVPSNVENQAKYLLHLGHAPTAHQLRGGGRTVSWYRGPCIPLHSNIAPIPFEKDIRSSDDLLIYDSQTGMLNISYAAAWELGKLMLLSEPMLGLKLQEWKNAEGLKRKYQDQQIQNSYLLIQNQKFDSDAGSALSNELKAYFDNLALLQGLPFHYLVSSEQYLPKESIRVFKLDNQWIEYLLKGAASVGGDLPPSQYTDRSGAWLPWSHENKPIYGMLLRSFAVEGWSALQIEAENASNSTIQNIRHEKLAPDILLCLFDEKVLKLNLFLPQEALHSEFLAQDGQLYLEKSQSRSQVPIVWKDANFKVIEAAKLQAALSDNNSNVGLAIQLLRLQEKVTFDLN